MQKKHIITIAGKPGSGKSTTAKLVATMLGYDHFSSGDLFRAIASEQQQDVFSANVAAEKDSSIDLKVDQRLREIGEQEDNKVVDSRTAWHWMPQSFKVYLALDFEVAAHRILGAMDKERLKVENIHDDPKQYATMLEARLASENRRYDTLYGIDPSDESNYDLVIDTAINTPDQVAKLVVDAYLKWQAS